MHSLVYLDIVSSISSAFMQFNLLHARTAGIITTISISSAFTTSECANVHDDLIYSFNQFCIRFVAEQLNVEKLKSETIFADQLRENVFQHEVSPSTN